MQYISIMETKNIILIICTILSFFTVFAVNGVTIVIPSIAAEYGMSNIIQNWVTIIFLLVVAVLSVPAGQISGKYGLKKVTIFNIILFNLNEELANLSLNKELLNYDLKTTEFKIYQATYDIESYAYEIKECVINNAAFPAIKNFNDGKLFTNHIWEVSKFNETFGIAYESINKSLNKSLFQKYFISDLSVFSTDILKITFPITKMNLRNITNVLFVNNDENDKILIETANSIDFGDTLSLQKTIDKFDKQDINLLKYFCQKYPKVKRFGNTMQVLLNPISIGNFMFENNSSIMFKIFEDFVNENRNSINLNLTFDFVYNELLKYYPVEAKKYQKIIDAIELGLKNTNKIALLGAQISAHPEFNNIMKYLKDKMDSGIEIELGISSLRTDSVTPELVQTLVKMDVMEVVQGLVSLLHLTKLVLNKNSFHRSFYLFLYL